MAGFQTTIVLCRESHVQVVSEEQPTAYSKQTLLMSSLEIVPKQRIVLEHYDLLHVVHSESDNVHLFSGRTTMRTTHC